MASNNCINTAGFVHKSAQYSSSLAQVLPDITATDIAFNIDELTDTHVTKSPNTVFTVNEDGLYHISASIKFTAGAIAGAH